MFENIAFDLFILGLFGMSIYAFLVAPRQREFRKRQKFVRRVEPGTRVITYGGIIGTLVAIDKEQGIVTLEVAEGVHIRLIAAAITGEFDAETYAESAQKVMGDEG